MIFDLDRLIIVIIILLSFSLAISYFIGDAIEDQHDTQI